MAIQTRIINGSYTEIYVGGGKFITQGAPTNFHQFWTQKILVGSETIEDFMEVTATEKTALEAADAKWERPPQEFIDHWNIRAGENGKYNESTGFSELNGIHDIDYTEAMQIDTDSVDFCQPTAENLYAHKYPRGRTLFAFKTFGYMESYRICFAYCGQKVIRLNSGYPGGVGVSDAHGMFQYCTALQKILGVIQIKGDTKDAFLGCQSLEEFRIEIMGNFDLDFRESPLVSLDSIEYLVTKATNTSPITITLHPDAYARVTDELFALAVEKNITIAST